MKNNGITFKFPVIDFLSLILPLIFGVCIFFIMESFFLYLIKDTGSILGAILSILICIGLFTFVTYLAAADSVLLKYLRYKKVLSSHSINSVADFVSITDGKYGDESEVEITIDTLMEKKCISGFKIDNRTNFFIFNKEKSEICNSTESLSELLTNLYELYDHEILGDEALENGERRIFAKTNDPTKISISKKEKHEIFDSAGYRELLINLYDLRDQCILTNEEFNKGQFEIHYKTM